MIAVLRPGAIGDIIMSLNLIPELKRLNPNKKIHYYCDPGIGAHLAPLMKLVGVDDGFPHTLLDRSRYDRVIPLLGYPLHEGYPQVKMKRHIIEYFAQEMGLEPKMYRFVIKAEKKDYATIHPKAGWSAYKEWPLERWERVIERFPNLKWVQIGAETDPRLKGADYSFLGKNIMESFKLLAEAKIHVGIDSWTNNASWMTETPSVILWGSSQVEATGYPHNANICLNLSCQPCFKESPYVSMDPKGPCTNPPNQIYDNPNHFCMMAINEDLVCSVIQNTLDRVG